MKKKGKNITAEVEEQGRVGLRTARGRLELA